jgi:hypothetical protein
MVECPGALVGQGKTHFAGNGMPFPSSATQNWPSSGALSVTEFTERPTRAGRDLK